MVTNDRPRLALPEKPGRRTSELWGYRDQIEDSILKGYTYAQIAEALAAAGVKVSVGWLKSWAGKAKLRSRPPRRGKAAHAPPAISDFVPPGPVGGSVGQYIEAATQKQDTPPPPQQEPLTEFQKLVQTTSPNERK